MSKASLVEEFTDLNMEDDTQSHEQPLQSKIVLPPSLGPLRANRQRKRKSVPGTASSRTQKRKIQRANRIAHSVTGTWHPNKGAHSYADTDYLAYEDDLPPADRRTRRDGMPTPRQQFFARNKYQHRGNSRQETIGYHIPRGASLQEVCYTMELFLDNSLTADGSGVILMQVANNPSFCTNWSSLSTPFEEYRVAAFDVTFEPAKTFGTTVYGPIATVIDRDDSTALTGYSVAARYSSYRLHAGQTAFRVYARSSGINELGFVPCSTPVSDLWIKAYSSGNTASLVAGRYVARFIVIFKGMGLT